MEEASAHNLGIAKSLLGAKDACGATTRAPSQDDLFEVADLRIVILAPQVGNVTSNRAAPQLVWSWSASLPETAEFEIASENCPDGVEEYYNPSEPEFANGALEYSYLGEVKRVALGGGDSPVQLNLSGEAEERTDIALDFAHESAPELAYENLSMKLVGEIRARYSYRKSTYEYVCHQLQGGIGCGCESEAEFGMRTFRMSLSDSRTFFVETEPVEEVWLNPPLNSRLAGLENGKLAFFARRMPAKISVYSEGNLIGEAAPYRFEESLGSCGQKEVKRIYSPEGKGAVINISQNSTRPFQLVSKNKHYVPIYFEFGWNESAGKRGVSLVYEDCFSAQDNFSRNFSVREPALFKPDEEAGNEAGVILREGSESLSPALHQSAARQEMPSSGAAVLAVALLLPLLLGAESFLRRAERHF
ncbi:MAG: hypothetical protein NT051_07030 [Candidatus Micrarchaeota archaeon]|nr:hypothetical protein [Candidatus Micrarchaeota archaeon]